MSKESLVARQYRLREWASQIQECNSRPAGVTVQQWCDEHGMTKPGYYYRMNAVRKACLDELPAEVVEQAIVPIPTEIMNGSKPETVKPFLEVTVNGITISVTEDTSPFLLERVLRVAAHVK